MGDTPKTDHEVITLSLRERPVGQSLLESLESYWRELRGRNPLPARKAICPSRIDDVLPDAFVMERVAPGIARLRVCGHRLTDVLGVDGRGMPLSALFRPTSQSAIGAYVEQVFCEPAIVELPLRLSRGLLRAPLTGRLLILPLTDGRGDVTRAIGALVVDGVFQKGPIKFDLADDAPIRVEPIMRSTPALWLAAAVGTPAQSKGPTHERPALKLVVNNP